MKLWIWSVAVLALGCAAGGESHAPIRGTAAALEEFLATPMPTDRGVVVHALGRSDDTSLQLVRVRERVAPHFHARHTETVTLVSGSGRFLLGDRWIDASVGDSFLVPPGTVHGFEVTGEGPATAVTTFSPPFDGADRVLLDEEDGN